MENKMKRMLDAMKKDRDIPENVSSKVDETLERLPSVSAINADAPRPRGKKHHCVLATAGKAAGAAAAAILVLFAVYKANPAMAKEMPLFGDIFRSLEGEVSYSGDYSSHATDLTPASVPSAAKEAATSSGEQIVSSADAAQTAAADTYTATDKGVTVTFSQVYANDQAIYLTLHITNENGFNNVMYMKRDNGTEYPAIYFLGEQALSFLPASSAAFNYAYPEGRLLDSKNYEGILRIDLADDMADRSEYEVPDSFTLTMNFSYLFNGMHAGEDDAADYEIEGNWNFTIPVTVDASQTVTQTFDDRAETGYGLSVTKTPYEFRIDGMEADGTNSDIFIVVFDADGQRISPASSTGSLNDFPAADYDLSKVEVYFADYNAWFDRGDTESGDQAWLEEHALYHKTVTF